MTSLPPIRLTPEKEARAERAYFVYDQTVRHGPWIGGLGHVPHPKQQRFLFHVETRELFYGGAGGGGKSQAQWYGALQFVDVPGYAALILRRTYADLAKAGALMDRSKEYLAGTPASWNERDKQWTFPSGAKIVFGYLQHEGNFGFVPCVCGRTDGTVDCEHKRASDMIAAAFDFLAEHDGEEVETADFDTD